MKNYIKKLVKKYVVKYVGEDLAKIDTRLSEIEERVNREVKASVSDAWADSLLKMSTEGICFELSGLAEPLKGEKPELEIDWSIPGQLVTNDTGVVLMTSGRHTEYCFTGTIIIPKSSTLGVIADSPLKSLFHPYTGGPITLNP